MRVDVHVLDHCGNLADAAALAALAALLAFRRPEASVAPGGDGERAAVTLHAPDAREPLPLSLHHLPLAVSFALFEVRGFARPGEGSGERYPRAVWAARCLLMRSTCVQAAAELHARRGIRCLEWLEEHCLWSVRLPCRWNTSGRVSGDRARGVALEHCEPRSCLHIWPPFPPATRRPRHRPRAVVSAMQLVGRCAGRAQVWGATDSSAFMSSVKGLQRGGMHA